MYRLWLGHIHPLLGRAACDKCGAGRYVDVTGSDDVSDCIACSAGKYLEAAGSSAGSDCIPCNTGTYSPTEGNALPGACIACVAGKWVDTVGSTNASDCIVCGAGTYGTLDTVSVGCIDCPGGTAQSLDAQTSCVACGSGEYSAVGAISCAPCAAGRYDHDSSAATSCEACSAGTVSGVRATVCRRCGAGEMDDDSDPSTPCVGCTAGRYQNASGSTSCESCATGRYQGQSGQRSCVDCGAGRYADVVASPDCIACAAGQFSAQSAATHELQCQLCQPGRASTIIAGNSSAVCEECAAGTYQSNAGATSCSVCIEGRFAAARAATKCDSCGPGTIQPDEGASDCQHCTTGRFQRNAAQVFCAPCANLCHGYGNCTVIGECACDVGFSGQRCEVFDPCDVFLSECDEAHPAALCTTPPCTNSNITCTDPLDVYERGCVSSTLPTPAWTFVQTPAQFHSSLRTVCEAGLPTLIKHTEDWIALAHHYQLQGATANARTIARQICLETRFSSLQCLLSRHGVGRQTLGRTAATIALQQEELRGLHEEACGLVISSSSWAADSATRDVRPHTLESYHANFSALGMIILGQHDFLEGQYPVGAIGTYSQDEASFLRDRLAEKEVTLSRARIQAREIHDAMQPRLHLLNLLNSSLDHAVMTRRTFQRDVGVDVLRREERETLEFKVQETLRNAHIVEIHLEDMRESQELEEMSFLDRINTGRQHAQQRQNSLDAALNAHNETSLAKLHRLQSEVASLSAIVPGARGTMLEAEVQKFFLRLDETREGLQTDLVQMFSSPRARQDIIWDAMEALQALLFNVGMSVESEQSLSLEDDMASLTNEAEREQRLLLEYDSLEEDARSEESQARAKLSYLRQEQHENFAASERSLATLQAHHAREYAKLSAKHHRIQQENSMLRDLLDAPEEMAESAPINCSAGQISHPVALGCKHAVQRLLQDAANGLGQTQVGPGVQSFDTVVLNGANECCGAHQICYSTCGHSQAFCDQQLDICMRARFSQTTMSAIADARPMVVQESVGCECYRRAQGAYVAETHILNSTCARSSVVPTLHKVEDMCNAVTGIAAVVLAGVVDTDAQVIRHIARTLQDTVRTAHIVLHTLHADACEDFPGQAICAGLDPEMCAQMARRIAAMETRLSATRSFVTAALELASASEELLGFTELDTELINGLDTQALDLLDHLHDETFVDVFRAVTNDGPLLADTELQHLAAMARSKVDLLRASCAAALATQNFVVHQAGLTAVARASKSYRGAIRPAAHHGIDLEYKSRLLSIELLHILSNEIRVYESLLLTDYAFDESTAHKHYLTGRALHVLFQQAEARLYESFIGAATNDDSCAATCVSYTQFELDQLSAERDNFVRTGQLMLSIPLPSETSYWGVTWTGLRVFLIGRSPGQMDMVTSQLGTSMFLDQDGLPRRFTHEPSDLGGHGWSPQHSFTFDGGNCGVSATVRGDNCSAPLSHVSTRHSPYSGWFVQTNDHDVGANRSNVRAVRFEFEMAFGLGDFVGPPVLFSDSGGTRGCVAESFASTDATELFGAASCVAASCTPDVCTSRPGYRSAPTPSAWCAGPACTLGECCVENLCSTGSTAIPGYTVAFTDSAAVSELGDLACEGGYVGRPVAECPVHEAEFVLSGCMARMCSGNEHMADNVHCGAGYAPVARGSQTEVGTIDPAGVVARCCERLLCQPSDCGEGLHLKPDAETQLPPAGMLVSELVCCDKNVFGVCVGNTDSSGDVLCPVPGYDRKANASWIRVNSTSEDRVATCCDRVYCSPADCGYGFRPRANATRLPPPGVRVSQQACCEAETVLSAPCPLGFYKQFGADPTEDVCTLCSNVSNAGANASYTCRSSTDSHVSDCASGFFKLTGGIHDADSCVACRGVPNANSSAIYSCTSARDSRVSACATGFTKLVGGSGEADVCTVTGMCTRNSDSVNEPDVICAPPSRLRDASHLVLGRTSLACCHVTGMCIGNTVAEHDNACPRGYEHKPESQMIENSASGGSARSRCCDRVYCQASDCPPGFHLKPAAESELPPEGTATSQDSCCDADIEGMCAGNTDGNDFSCPVAGYRLRSDANATTTTSDTSEEDRVATCCDRVYCSPADCGYGFRPRANATRLPPPGVRVSQQECCEAETVLSAPCPLGFYKQFGADPTEDVCTLCSTVSNAGANASYTCRSSTDSHVSDCASGFFKLTGGIHDADSCVACRGVPNANSSAIYSCTSARDSRVSACATGFTKLVGGSGEADVCTVTGMCTRNSDSVNEPDVICAPPSRLRDASHLVLGRTSLACCHVTGMCIGNSDPLEDIICHATHIAVDGASNERIVPGNTTQCCEPIGRCANVTCRVPSADSCQTGGTCRGGQCQPIRAAADGSACDDGLRATSHDICTDGVCAGKAVLATSLVLPVDAPSVDAIAAIGTPQRARLENQVKQVLLPSIRAAGLYIAHDDIMIHSFKAGSVVVDFSMRVPVDEATSSNQERIGSELATSTGTLTLGDQTVQLSEVTMEPLRLYSWVRHPGLCGNCADGIPRVVNDRYECSEDGFGALDSYCVAIVGPMPVSGTECCTFTMLLSDESDWVPPDTDSGAVHTVPVAADDDGGTISLSALLVLVGLILVACGGVSYWCRHAGKQKSVDMISHLRKKLADARARGSELEKELAEHRKAAAEAELRRDMSRKKASAAMEAWQVSVAKAKEAALAEADARLELQREVEAERALHLETIAEHQGREQQLMSRLARMQQLAATAAAAAREAVEFEVGFDGSGSQGDVSAAALAKQDSVAKAKLADVAAENVRQLEREIEAEHEAHKEALTTTEDELHSDLAKIEEELPEGSAHIFSKIRATSLAKVAAGRLHDRVGQSVAQWPSAEPEPEPETELELGLPSGRRQKEGGLGASGSLASPPPLPHRGGTPNRTSTPPRKAVARGLPVARKVVQASGVVAAMRAQSSGGSRPLARRVRRPTTPPPQRP
eukprot:COSAG04_NODE_698_length_11049_cov_9.441370_2_plen_2967_part_00